MTEPRSEPNSDQNAELSDQDAERSFDANRRDQLTTAPKSTEADAEPRIETSRVDADTVRLDIRDDAAARPGTGSN